MKNHSAAIWKSAKKLNDEITTVLDESQIFRIDHYLGVVMRTNILSFRFGNLDLRAAAPTRNMSTACRSPWLMTLGHGRRRAATLAMIAGNKDVMKVLENHLP